jgi:hypothetical protein
VWNFEPLVLKPGEVLYAKLNAFRGGVPIERLPLQLSAGDGTSLPVTSCLEIQFATPNLVGRKMITVMHFDLLKETSGLDYMMDHIFAQRQTSVPQVIIQRSRTTIPPLNALIDWTVDGWCALLYLTRDQGAEFDRCTGSDFTDAL